MNASGDALLNHLRADNELKAEVIKALRADREHELQSESERSAMLASVAADMLTLATNAGLLLAEGASAAAQRSLENLKSVCADLADFTAARSGQLALSHRSVNIRQLLARIAVRHPVNLKISANVPERVIADEQHLAKIVAYFVDHDAVPGIRTLEVRHESVAEEASLVFLLSVRTSTEAAAQSPQQPSGLTRLHLALTQALCVLMGGSQTANRLTLPMRTAEDQAHTGIFRLAQMERGESPASAEVTADEVGAVDSQAGDESIDLMYLDRQLGSLAPVILGRTAPAFIAEAQRRMTDLHVARESEDLKRLHGIARAWRGSALAVGACRLAALFDAIDKQVALGRLPPPGAIWQVRSALDRTVRALEAHTVANGRHA